MSPASAPTSTACWALRHAWQSGSDLHALALARQALQGLGIALVDAPQAPDPATPVAAVKMHTMEIADALEAGWPQLQDLQQAALAADWAHTLPHFIQHGMRSGTRWHGIPMGIHRANLCWVHARAAESLAQRAPGDLRGFMRWLEQARDLAPHPLAVGAEPWQIGVLFETVVLSVAGPAAYRRAFVQRHPAAWREPDLQAAVACLQRLRRLVDDRRLHLGWQDQLACVQRGEAVVQVMGDWARVAGHEAVIELAFPGTERHFVAIADFFVPVREVAGTPAVALSQQVAMALTDPELQRAFALRKGCMPALRSAWAAVDPARAALLHREADVLPSWTFDQCCSVRWKSALMREVARLFLERCEPGGFIERLCQLTGACAGTDTHANSTTKESS